MYAGQLFTIPTPIGAACSGEAKEINPLIEDRKWKRFLTSRCSVSCIQPSTDWFWIFRSAIETSVGRSGNSYYMENNCVHGKRNLYNYSYRDFPEVNKLVAIEASRLTCTCRPRPTQSKKTMSSSKPPDCHGSDHEFSQSE